MKLLHLLSVAVALAAIQPAAALDKVRISATKKTLDKRESDNQKLPHGSTSLTEKQVIYSFSLQRMTPDVPETPTVSWIVMKERMDGRLVEAARGEAVVSLPLGRAVTTESSPVQLDEREWVGRKHAGSASSELAGYGLRVLNSKGEVVAERYEPADMQRAISWTPPAPAAESDRIAELQQKIREEKIRQRREEIDRARGLPK